MQMALGKHPIGNGQCRCLKMGLKEEVLEERRAQGLCRASDGGARDRGWRSAGTREEPECCAPAVLPAFRQCHLLATDLPGGGKAAVVTGLLLQ